MRPKGAGDVIVARTKDDDPTAIKRKAEPLILDAVAAELMRRGLQTVASQPDLILTLYLLLTNNMTTQSLGQFRGHNRVGLHAGCTGDTVHQDDEPGCAGPRSERQGRGGLAGRRPSTSRFEADDKKREAILREGVRDLFKRYPPKQ